MNKIDRILGYNLVGNKKNECLYHAWIQFPEFHSFYSFGYWFDLLQRKLLQSNLYLILILIPFMLPAVVRKDWVKSSCGNERSCHKTFIENLNTSVAGDQKMQQYHGCWCPVSLCHQAINSQCIGYVGYIDLWLPSGCFFLWPLTSLCWEITNICIALKRTKFKTTLISRKFHSVRLP